MTVFLAILSGGLILSGLLFFFGASIGLLRFPDFYTRMHAAGKGDTLSTLLIMAGIALFLCNDFHGLATLLTILKIFGICALIMLTSPTSTHALMRAGFNDRLTPYTRDGSGFGADFERAESPPGKKQESAADAKSAQKKSTGRKAAKKKATKKKAAKKKAAKKKAAKKKAAKKKAVKKKAVKKKAVKKKAAKKQAAAGSASRKAAKKKGRGES